MSVLTRNSKGAALTHTEMDNNWTDLDGRIVSVTTTVTGHTSQIAGLPQFYKDGSDNVQGISDGTNDYPMVANPVELLSHSSAGFTSALLSVDEVLKSYTIKAGTLGPNSILQIDPLWTFSNSANNKILRVKVGGTTVYDTTRTGTAIKEAPMIVLSNRNSLSSQIRAIDSNYVVSSTSAPQTYTINFANDVVVEFCGNRTSGSDTLKLEYYRILHFVGD